MKKFKISMNTVKNIDYVLVLLAAILALIFFAVQIIDELRPYRFPSHEVQVAHEEEKAQIVEKISFERKLRDVFVFSVQSSAVDSTQLGAYQPEGVYDFSNSIKGKQGSSFGITNLIFIDEDGTDERRLFSQNLFVHTVRYADFGDEKLKYFRKNMYASVSDDTNGDGKLNENDFIQLFVSDYDGKNLKMLAGNIFSTEFAGDDTLVYADFQQGEQKWYAYNAKTDKSMLLKTTNEKPDGKHILMY